MKNLIVVIFYDIYNHYMVTFFLFLMVLLSAKFLVCLTYETRMLVIEYESLLVKENDLRMEWNLLILRKSLLENNFDFFDKRYSESE